MNNFHLCVFFYWPMLLETMGTQRSNVPFHLSSNDTLKIFLDILQLMPQGHSEKKNVCPYSEDVSPKQKTLDLEKQFLSFKKIWGCTKMDKNNRESHSFI